MSKEKDRFNELVANILEAYLIFGHEFEGRDVRDLYDKNIIRNTVLQRMPDLTEKQTEYIDIFFDNFLVSSKEVP